MAQFNDLIVTGAARFINTISGTFEKAIKDGNGNDIDSTYMKKGVDYVTAGKKSGSSIGLCSTAEGYNVYADAPFSHAEGESTKAIQEYSHSEGGSTIAEGSITHAEGYNTDAIGSYSHAEGNKTTAIGTYSHAEGGFNEASGLYSHATGLHTICRSSATASHTMGSYTIAASPYQLVIGEYNIEDADSKYAFIIGTTPGKGTRANALTVTFKGMVTMGYTNGVAPSVLPHINSITLNDLITKVRYYNGCFGTATLSATVGNLKSGCIYAYVFMPHRSGGVDGAASGDNCNYGNLLMLAISSEISNYSCVVRFSNGTVGTPITLYSM